VVPLAVFTQTAQRSAAVAKRLGINKDASPDEYLGAIDDLLSRAAPSDDGEVDPAAVARTRALDEREWNVARREYGDPIVDAAQAFSDAQRTNRSPLAQAAAFAAAVYEVAATLNGASPAPAGGTQPQAPAKGQPVETPDLGDLPQGGVPSGDLDPRDYQGNTQGYMARLMEKAGLVRPG
jgi:hypothetical protein